MLLQHKLSKGRIVAGLLISFEGIDGAGKSTHIAPLAQALQDQGRDVLLTREPGGTPLAEKLRGMILNEPMDILTETLLAFAARRDHIESVIRPALERGTVVLCDRFTDSTYAYQGHGRTFGTTGHLEIISQLEKWVQTEGLNKNLGPLLQPDLTLWFDLDPKIAAQRLTGARKPDRFESLNEQFFSQVRRGYLSRMNEHPLRIKRIEAFQQAEDVYQDVLSHVRDLLSPVNRRRHGAQAGAEMVDNASDQTGRAMRES